MRDNMGRDHAVRWPCSVYRAHASAIHLYLCLCGVLPRAAFSQLVSAPVTDMIRFCESTANRRTP
jgi:hypothetical protein